MTVSRNDFSPEIQEGVDWDLYNKQNNIAPEKPTPKAMQLGKNDTNSFGNRAMQGVDTFNKTIENYVRDPALGFMQGIANIPSAVLNTGKNLLESSPVLQHLKKEGKYKGMPDVPYFNNAPNTLPAEAGEALSLALGGRAPAEIAARGAKSAKDKISNVYDYLHPSTAERKAEEFRSTLGEGTSAENIETLGKRAKLAASSSKAEALIPKEELYKKEGKSNVYDVDKASLPEGNMQKFGSMFHENEQGFSDEKMGALSKALSDYRKTGKIDSFLDKSEDIFGIPELPEKATSKIEDVLSMPVKRDSKYFSDEDVDSFYGKKGKLRALHDSYEEKPTLNNYFDLQSKLKEQQRTLNSRYKNKTITDLGEKKLDQFNENISNLESDHENFIKTLPENMQNLEGEFRQKYKSYASKYKKGEKDAGSSLTLRRLAEGKHSLVTDSQVTKVFSNPTISDKRIMLDMGPSAARNALYAALQRVPEGNAEEMAKTVLDLKRTKGFDNIVTKEMEDWATNMLSYVGKTESIRRNLSNTGRIATHGASALAGGMLGGPIGAAVGAALPFGWKTAKYLAEKLKK